MDHSVTSSPMQAKAKRKQSDAKWRASVATCYGTLKYVVPNVKNMTKRKISKALILQESEQHIKELEAAVIQLLDIESEQGGKTVLWKEGRHWSPCSLEKLRFDFSEKQERVFHIAAHGRRCYNLLQDIKEEVFAMQADPSQLSVLQRANFSTPTSSASSVLRSPVQSSSLLSSSCSLTSSSSMTLSSSLSACSADTNLKKGIFTTRLQPSSKVSLVLATLRGNQAANFNQVRGQSKTAKRVPDETLNDASSITKLFTSIAKRKQNEMGATAFTLSSKAEEKFTTSSIVTLKVAKQAGDLSSLSGNIARPGAVPASNLSGLKVVRPISSLPPPSVSWPQPSLQVSPKEPVQFSEGLEHGALKDQLKKSCSYGGKGKVSTSMGSSMAEYRQRNFTKNYFSPTSEYKPDEVLKSGSTVSANSADLTDSQSNGGKKLKIRLTNVDGDFYILSDSFDSIAHLFKGPPSGAKMAQGMSSMKLPLKPPCEEQSNASKDLMILTGLKKAPAHKKVDSHITHTDVGYLCKQQISTRAKTAAKAPEAQTTTSNLTESESITSKSYHKQTNSNELDAKQGREVEDIHTPKHVPHLNESNKDPLLSSLATPRLEETTPLFMKTENNMVVKRAPRLGTARKKLNFGSDPCHSTTPDKDSSFPSRRQAPSCRGFTPVKLPDEFGMVPDCDGTGCPSSLVSPWKAVDSPSFESRIVPQNFLDPSSMLDLDDPLICLETMDTMDLDDESDCMYASSSAHGGQNHLLQNQETTTFKRKLSPTFSKESSMPKPKCRRKLDKYYDEPSSSWDHDDLGTEQIVITAADDTHLVPDVFVSGQEEEGKDISPDANCYAMFDKELQRKCSFSDKCEDVSHVVPDLNTEGKEGSFLDHGQENDERLSLASENDIYKTAANSDSFDGFFYYYRLMSEQMHKESNDVYDGGNKRRTFYSEPGCNTTATFSSPFTAARVAHMWSQLPQKDKMTMAALASMEDTCKMQTRDETYSDVISNFLENGDLAYDKSEDYSLSSQHEAENVAQPDSDTPTKLNHWDKGECSEKHIKSNSLTFELQDFCKKSSKSDYNEKMQKFGDAMDNREANIDSNYFYEDIHDCLEENGVPGSFGKRYSCPRAHLSQITADPPLGSLSQDLQDIEVQPLVDHTYNHSFDLF